MKFKITITIEVDTKDYLGLNSTTESALRLAESIVDGEADWPGEGYPSIEVEVIE